MIKRIFLKEQLFSARLVNYSVGGFMIESDVKFRPEEALTIHMSKDRQKETSFFSDTCLWLVRWCAQQDGFHGGFYGVGV